jgi:hypothetical protein
MTEVEPSRPSCCRISISEVSALPLKRRHPRPQNRPSAVPTLKRHGGMPAKHHAVEARGPDEGDRQNSVSICRGNEAAPRRRLTAKRNDTAQRTRENPSDPRPHGMREIAPPLKPAELVALNADTMRPPPSNGQQITERDAGMSGEFGHQRSRGHAGLGIDLQPDHLAVFGNAVVVAEIDRLTPRQPIA